MSNRFREWLACPACGGDADVGVLAHQTELVLECYDCGTIAEFELGRDVPFGNVSLDRLESDVFEFDASDGTDDRTTES